MPDRCGGYCPSYGRRNGSKRGSPLSAAACRAPAVRLTAALADRYRIERELGAGGMATVWRSAIACCRRSVVFMVRRIRDASAHRHGYRYHDKPVDATEVVGIARVHG